MDNEWISKKLIEEAKTNPHFPFNKVVDKPPDEPLDEDTLIRLGCEGMNKNNLPSATHFFKEAIKIYKSSTSMYNLALIYETTNPSRVKEFLEGAGERGISDAYLRLGNLYELGTIFLKDIDKAIDNYKKAIELGNIKAMYNLGNIYHEGIYVSQDYGKALMYYEMASKESEHKSIYAMGLMFLKGEGVKHDAKNAEIYIRRAAELGNREAIATVEYITK